MLPLFPHGHPSIDIFSWLFQEAPFLSIDQGKSCYWWHNFQDIQFPEFCRGCFLCCYFQWTSEGMDPSLCNQLVESVDAHFRAMELIWWITWRITAFGMAYCIYWHMLTHMLLVTLRNRCIQCVFVLYWCNNPTFQLYVGFFKGHKATQIFVLGIHQGVWRCNFDGGKVHCDSGVFDTCLTSLVWVESKNSIHSFLFYHKEAKTGNIKLP